MVSSACLALAAINWPSWCKEHTARMACGVCALSLILNFVFTPNRNYREVTPLQRIYFLDESASVAQDLSNPWMLT
jgi:hypothetical protein